MPEFVEAEAYRRTISPVIGHEVARVDIRDPRLLRRDDRPPDLVRAAIEGSTVDAVRRIGKVVLVDLSSGHTATLSFGLRGWLTLDGRLARASGGWRDRAPRHDHVRLRLDTTDGHAVELEDQLRLAALELDVDEDRYGIDVLALDKRAFRNLLATSGAAIKSLLMDQRRIAGIGNLIADEMLYQGGVDPRRRASSIADDELDALWLALRGTRNRVLRRNGSHQGVLIQSGARERGAHCPRCDVEVERVTVGGRTSYLCPAHQH